MSGDARPPGRPPTLAGLLSDLHGSYADDDGAPMGRVLRSVERVASAVERGASALERGVSALERLASVLSEADRTVVAMERAAAALERLAPVERAALGGMCPPGALGAACLDTGRRWCRGRLSPLAPRCSDGS